MKMRVVPIITVALRLDFCKDTLKNNWKYQSKSFTKTSKNSEVSAGILTRWLSLNFEWKSRVVADVTTYWVKIIMNSPKPGHWNKYCDRKIQTRLQDTWKNSQKGISLAYLFCKNIVSILSLLRRLLSWRKTGLINWRFYLSNDLYVSNNIYYEVEENFFVKDSCWYHY